MPTPLLEVRHLSKTFQDRRPLRRAEAVHAVRDVSFTLESGSIVGLVGESSCGKSTLAQLLVRLIDGDEGRIVFEGRDITAMSAREFRPLRPKLQLILQDPYAAFDPRMCLEKQLTEALRAHRIDTGRETVREYAARMAGECGIEPGLLSRYPAELSGGQLQRLAIARSIALMPSMLIADEIVSALDVAVQGQLLRLLRHMRDDHGVGILFITHDLAVARALCDRILVMHRGEIIEEGTPEALFCAPKADYTRALLAAVPEFRY